MKTKWGDPQTLFELLPKGLPFFFFPSLPPSPPWNKKKNACRLAGAVAYCIATPLPSPSRLEAAYPAYHPFPPPKKEKKTDQNCPCSNHDKHQQGSLRSAILDLPVSVAGRVIDTKGTSATQCGHCLPRGSPLGQTTWSEPLTAWLADCTHHMLQHLIINRKWYTGRKSTVGLQI